MKSEMQIENHISGLCLTFDDCFIEEWFSALNMFAKFQAKATFFVSYFHLLDEIHINMLKEIQSKGHEIGYHSLSHPKAKEFLSQYTIQEYLDHEISPGLELMNSAGFTPKSFAFPYNQSTEELESQLLDQFDILRLRSHKLVDAMHPRYGNKILYGKCIDLNVDNIPDIKRLSADDIVDDFRLAYTNSQILVTYAHSISNEVGPQSSISPFGLEYLLYWACEIGLKFYTASDLTS